MSTKTDTAVRMVRDLLSMGAGAAVFVIQALNNSWNLMALGLCAILLGVPLVNIKKLMQQAMQAEPVDTHTQESSSQSPPP